MTLGKRGGVSVLLALALTLGIASSASATVRHASPGASGPEPCASASPCSLYDAINGSVNGDEVIVSPGEYTDTAGDLGGPAVHGIQIPVNVDVRGEAESRGPRSSSSKGNGWAGR